MTNTPTKPEQPKQSIDITMPSLGADMTEGQLTQWLVKPGDKVKNGDIIAVLETHKGAIDMEAYHEGTISEILLEPVITVPVGTVMAKMMTSDEVNSGESNPQAAKSAPLKETYDIPLISGVVPDDVESKTLAVSNNSQADSQRILMSPIVRKQLLDGQITINNIRGSGPNGAIVLRDVSSQHGLQDQTKTPLSSDNKEAMREAIAIAMETSKQTIPHFYASLDISVSTATNWLANYNVDKPPEQQMLLLALFLKAIAKALVKVPAMNGFYQNHNFVAASDIHIGNVINLRTGGLMVPAIHYVDSLSLPEIMSALRDITTRSRTGHLKSSELTDATITVTNTGERGLDAVYGVIYPPQVSLISLGKTRKVAQLVESSQSWLNDEVITVCVSADHRVVDGMVAAKFLHLLAKYLQQPERL